MGLSFDEGEFCGQASRIGECHDLGVSPASRLAHGLCGGSAFGIGCALMHPHMRAIDQSDPAFDLPGQPGKHPPPEPVPSPAPIPSIDRAPGAKALGQVSPRTCVAQQVEQGVKHHVQSCWRTTAYLAGTIFLSRPLSGPHHAKRCVFTDFLFYINSLILPIDRFSNTA